MVRFSSLNSAPHMPQLIPAVGQSTYAPGWVKKDPGRFPRALIRESSGVIRTGDVLSLFNSEAQKADAKAFHKLMEHLKQIDKNYHTVIMVQVENEVGLLGDSRDRAPSAELCFTSPVPQKLLDVLSTQWNTLHETLKVSLTHFANFQQSSTENLSWGSVFGRSPQTDELFMAYHYATYVEQVASAGKETYPLPLFTNVWQNRTDEDEEEGQPVIVGGGGQPGDYPSGGAEVHVLDIWHHMAPSLDFIAPDIYLNNYNLTCAKYRHGDQPLFIPEQRRDEHGARRIWTALGSYQALGTAPFGIDTIAVSESPFRKHYQLLANVSQLILAAQQRSGSSIGFYFDEWSPKSENMVTATFGPWHLHIERSLVFGTPSPGYGIVIHLDEARFLLIGEGFQVKFSSKKPTAYFTGILEVAEKEVINQETGQMRSWRFLGGDETRSGQAAVMPSENPDYGSFPICITIPSRTKIAEVEVYALENEPRTG
jgi:hypothetical protein